MQTNTTFYLILTLLLSILVAYYLYFYKSKDKRKIITFLFVLRALSLFLLGLLFINPSIKKRTIKDIKPVLAVLVDNSLSIKHFKESKSVEKSIEKIKSNKQLNNKFAIKYFSFAKDLQLLDSLTFSKYQTNIYKAITSINELFSNQKKAIILITDGNQTIGNDYEFLQDKQVVYPVVIGDTIKYKDLKITLVNVNKYSYLKNRFPVEVFVTYDGDKPIDTQLSIFKGKKKVFTKKIKLSSKNNSTIITTHLISNKEGHHFYTVTLKKLNDEKNVLNNTKTFSVEVMNQQTKVLIVTSVIHPDLGVLKRAIEKNKQRTVEIKLANEFNKKVTDYQLIILYQPTNNFKKIIHQIKSNKQNYLLISGTNTNWSFVNNQHLGFTKQFLEQTESYTAFYNSMFSEYFQQNIGFHTFPSLEDKFGEIQFTTSFKPLLYQQIVGVKTNQPLLAMLENNNQKTAVLFGEGIWKWRASFFLQEQNFNEFDEFLGNIVQYLSSYKKRNRLTVNFDKFYTSNNPIIITAFYVDKNFKFDNRASMWLYLTNLKTKERKKLPFSLVQNTYQLTLENETPGKYKYNITVDNQSVSNSGRFTIVNYNAEEQFVNANLYQLKKLASLSDNMLYFPSTIDEMIEKLNADDNYFTTQKSSFKEIQLIYWKWLLLVILFLLSIEWFVRKFYGKI